jgi:hypothetical protein
MVLPRAATTVVIFWSQDLCATLSRLTRPSSSVNTRNQPPFFLKRSPICFLWRAVGIVKTKQRVSEGRIGTHALPQLAHKVDYQIAFQTADVLQNIAVAEGTFGT